MLWRAFLGLSVVSLPPGVSQRAPTTSTLLWGAFSRNMNELLFLWILVEAQIADENIGGCAMVIPLLI